MDILGTLALIASVLALILAGAAYLRARRLPRRLEARIHALNAEVEELMNRVQSLEGKWGVTHREMYRHARAAAADRVEEKLPQILNQTVQKYARMYAQSPIPPQARK